MTARPSRPGRAPVIVVVAAVAVAATTLTGTLLTWHTTISASQAPRDRAAWASGAWPAVGASLATVGVLVLLAATVGRGRIATLGVAAGAVVTVGGVVTLVTDRFGPTGLASLTYASSASSPPNRFLESLPDASAWIMAGGLGAIVVAAAALPSSPPRHRTVLALVLVAVGAVALAIGGTAFPWSVGVAGRALVAVPVWRANAGGASLVVLAAVATGVALWRQVRGAALTAGLLAAAGLGLLLIDRLPNPWGVRTTGWSAYQPVESIEIAAPWRFQAATSLVLLGAVLVLIAAVLAARRPAAPVRAVV